MIQEPTWTRANGSIPTWEATGVRAYVQGPLPDERLIWMEGRGADRQVSYPHTDRRGSTIALSRGGQAVATYAYDEYGQGRPQDGVTGYPFRYTGQRLDPYTGTYHYKAREYSPTLGRFLQPDPARFVDGPNIYAYVGNNPWNAVDPTGMDGCSDMAGQGLGGSCFEASNFNGERHGSRTVIGSSALDDGAVANGSSLATRVPDDENFGELDRDGNLSVLTGQERRPSLMAGRHGDGNATTAVTLQPSEEAAAIEHSHSDSNGSLLPGWRNARQNDMSPLNSQMNNGNGIPNYIYNNGRIGVLEVSEGRVRFRVVAGELTFDERNGITERLNQLQNVNRVQ